MIELTDGDTKARLVQGIFNIASETRQSETSWNDIRGEKYLWDKLLQIKICETTSYAQVFSDEEVASTSSAPGSPLGSESLSDDEVVPTNLEDLSWFMQPTGKS